MRVIIQRVIGSSVEIEGKINGQIGLGLLVLLGIEDADTDEDITWLCNKISNLRIFADDQGVMNRSIREVEGDVLMISQFTLHARVKKGNRPSYINAASPDVAIPMYEKFKSLLEETLGKKVETGEFGADMKVSLLNDGPVTIFIDTKNKE
ncbi:MAG: D-tyrosyl-tRNA(Tyr) deacylase [Flavobacteriales bacterium]|nr:D-tyrosyl-tRNA(Tyr) deacylase [Flavobacteriales bacterium]